VPRGVVEQRHVERAFGTLVMPASLVSTVTDRRVCCEIRGAAKLAALLSGVGRFTCKRGRHESAPPRFLPLPRLSSAAGSERTHASGGRKNGPARRLSSGRRRAVEAARRRRLLTLNLWRWDMQDMLVTGLVELSPDELRLVDGGDESFAYDVGRLLGAVVGAFVWVGKSIGDGPSQFAWTQK
jgi:hypothetical protein